MPGKQTKGDTWVANMGDTEKTFDYRDRVMQRNVNSNHKFSNLIKYDQNIGNQQKL